ncbi:Mitochondrial inner membrane protease atp23 [Thalictrum thalictroides]|uniref:Mitochondrial inner membrane protease ATP23 n=1 Tax=Thalictrum thalictroides TaxID=46969 RepID=A0A7J6WUX5_THATH|nr:Mitochondrial inner membrane protease atp23 [Thalictrum thalictroides]
MEDESIERKAPSLSSNVKGGCTVEECQGMIKQSLRNPMVKFLREHLVKAGCHVGDNFFEAIKCDVGVGGGYLRGDGIKVCSNGVSLQNEVDQVLIHELIHVYDDCRAANLEWENCAHHACSEIRANHLSGDCHYKRELLRGSMKIRGHEQECVRRRALMSVRNNPNCSKAAAKDAMDAVWDICYNDTKPFDRAP